MEIDKFQTSQEITWCRGCGNFGILVVLKQVFLELGWQPQDVVVVYGIGCHGHMVNYLNTYGFEGLHGRALPVAQGIKLAQPDLNVVAVVGDGDQLGEGGNHLIHAAKRNINITCIIHDNQLYSLTVGQTSPTSEKGSKTRSHPAGAIEEPLNPLALALAAGASFVARGFVGEVNHLKRVILEAINHQGFSLVDVLQPCVVLNKVNTYQYFFKRVYKLQENPEELSDKNLAFQKSQEWGEKIPIGIFYKEKKEVFEEKLPQLKSSKLNFKNLLEEFK